jgi:hypothetical protein
MAQLPLRFLGLVTRSVLAEMMASTYAESRNVEPNEAYERLDIGLKEVKLISGIQREIWAAAIALKPRLGDSELVDQMAKKVNKAKRFQPLKPKRAQSGSLAAVMVLIDMGAGFSTGEARDLLLSEEGEKLLSAGYKLIGAHLAAEMLR